MLAVGRQDGVVIVHAVQDLREVYRLRCFPRDHNAVLIHDIAWSADGRYLAAATADGMVRVWKTSDQTVVKSAIVAGLEGWPAVAVSWSHADHRLLVGSQSGRLAWLNYAEDWMVTEVARVPHELVEVLWAPNDDVVAVCTKSGLVRLFDPSTWDVLDDLSSETSVLALAWSHDGGSLAMGRGDHSVEIWVRRKDKGKGAWRSAYSLEGHTAPVFEVAYARDDRRLASLSRDGSMRVWDLRDLSTEAVIVSPIVERSRPGLAYNPRRNILAVVNSEKHTVQLWALGKQAPKAQAGRTLYANAKVVVLGDTGVGKTALCNALSDIPFLATESSHGIFVRTLSQTHEVKEGASILHEVALWDLAGQPGYRLLNELHLSDCSVALILFDSRSESDPFRGVEYWSRVVTAAAPSAVKLLVATRTDRGGPKVSRERVEIALDQWGLDGFIETSAKWETGVTDLRDHILTSIAWDTLPIISSSEVLANVREFLLVRKQAGSPLATFQQLLAEYNG